MGEAGKAKGPVDASPGRTPGKRRVQWTLRPAERRKSGGSGGRFARPNAGKAEGPVDASPGRTPQGTRPSVPRGRHQTSATREGEPTGPPRPASDRGRGR